MRTFIRLAAAALLAILLPIQAGAAACAEICALANAEHVPTISDHVHAQDHGFPGHDHADHCAGSDMGCCQGQVLMAGLDPATSPAALRSFERHHYVDRWTNFIPEEPSPPPIGAAPLA